MPELNIFAFHGGSLLPILLVCHIIADWFLQNEYVAKNKSNWKHPCAYSHSLLHFVLYSVVTSWQIAAFIAILHFIIDLRFILVWWKNLIGQTTTGEAALHVAIWQDQGAHFIVLVIACMINHNMKGFGF